MEIELTPEQDSLVNLGIEQGRIQRREDAVRDAMTLWEKRERARIELLAELEAGDDSFEEDDIVLDSDEAVAAFFEDIKQRGRAKLAAH
jgi:Arc/MetJ-type ribon-helix-helix transcriptional regulator